MAGRTSKRAAQAPAEQRVRLRKALHGFGGVYYPVGTEFAVASVWKGRYNLYRPWGSTVEERGGPRQLDPSYVEEVVR